MIRWFAAHPSALGEIRRLVRAEAESTLGEAPDRGARPDGLEACANVIRHTDANEIRLRWRLDGECVVMEIEDRGVFRNRMPVPELEPGGRGILLMTAFVDELAIREGTAGRPGTTLRLVKCKRD